MGFQAMIKIPNHRLFIITILKQHTAVTRNNPSSSSLSNTTTLYYARSIRHLLCYLEVVGFLVFYNHPVSLTSTLHEIIM